MNQLNNVFYTATSLILMGLAAVLAGTGPVFLARAILAGDNPVTAMVSALSYLILSLAVFDVARYVFDEEVRRGREMRKASETRRSITKFITVIIIAVLMDALVALSKAGQGELDQLVYPVVLILGASPCWSGSASSSASARRSRKGRLVGRRRRSQDGRPANAARAAKARRRIASRPAAASRHGDAAEVFNVTLWSARMFPGNTDPVPSVTELPIDQNTPLPAPWGTVKPHYPGREWLAKPQPIGRLVERVLTTRSP